MFDLTSETVAVVTGASSGIGRATALALAAGGVRLALLARREAALAEAASDARAAGSAEVIEIPCDIRDEKSVEAAFDKVLSHFGRLDILINSAGLSLNGEVDGYSLDDWRTVIETNLTGTFLTCRAAVPAMKRQGTGQIINVSSGAGRNGIRQMAAYCASKFGVVGFTESLGHEVRSHNIRISVILPGSVATEFSSVARRGDATDTGEDIGYAMTADEVAGVIEGMLRQPMQAWMSEVVLRPLNLELRRKRS